MFNFHKKIIQFQSKLFRGTSNLQILSQFGLFCAIALVTDYYSNYRIAHGLFRRIWKEEILIDLSKNYFLSAKELSNGKFLVDNDKCRIPDITIWNPSDRVHYWKKESPFKCKCNKVNLTYVKGQSIIFNEEVLPELGYENFSDMSCCYQSIFRVEQSEESFDENADNNFNYSQICQTMGKETMPTSNFIRVTCTSLPSSWKNIIYQNFHLVANFPKDDKALLKKLKYWKGYEKDSSKNFTKANKRPPNVLLIGIDSTSRLNFHRYMPQSKKILENLLGAVEMNGYTKVGENTFPNFVPIMTSFSQNELTKICFKRIWIPQDSCPYIWKEFSKRNYLTAHLEDSPKTAIFNYYKTGFIQKPVDLYLRPFMRAVYEDKWTIGCIGNQRPEQIVLDYIVNLANLSESRGIPYVITTWLTDLTHDDVNNIQHLDSVLSDMLMKLKGESLLENTILFVMSDHGYRFSNVRITKSGWYEDKLPAMFITLPTSVTTEYPHWNDALKYNSRQLTTPFDIHATIKQVLSTIPLGTITFTQNITSSNKIPQSNVLRGLSLLKELPSRSCSEAGVPKEYCACVPPTAYTKNLTTIRMVAEAVVRNINSELPSVCAQLNVASIFAAATLNNKLSNNSSVSFLISFTAHPGNFRYEALVELNNASDTFSRVENILRTDKKNRSTCCLTYEQEPLELKCYCSPPKCRV